MPRSINASLLGRLQDPHYDLNVYAEFTLPDDTLVRVSDSRRTGRCIIKEPPVIPPVIVRDEIGVPEMRSMVLVLSNRLASDGVADPERISTTLDIDGIEGCNCDVYVFMSTDSVDVAYSQLVFSGRVQAIESISQHEVRIRLDDRAAYLTRALNHLVSEDYPQAPAEHASRLQPIMYGGHEDYAPVPVDVGQIGTLAETITSGASSLVLTEDISAWPTTGLIQIDQELITYSGVTAADRTLTGLTRAQHGTIAASHVEGAPVIQRPESYTFLLADRDYGAIQGVTAVRIAGTVQPPGTWSFDQATNLLTVQPVNIYSGRKSMNRTQAITEGIWPLGASLANTTFQRPSVVTPKYGGDPSKQPLINPAHGMMIPALAAAETHYFPALGRGDVPSLWLLDGDDELYDASTIKLEANTPKSWVAADFDTYLPPETMFARTGFSVCVSLMPRLRLVVASAGAAGTFDAKVVCQGLRALKCTAGGVTKTLSINPNGAFANPSYTASLSNSGLGNVAPPEEHFIFDFTGALDPSQAPFDVTLEAICDGPNDGTHVARVQSLTQSIDGVLPMAGVTGTCEGVTDAGYPVGSVENDLASNNVTVTFAETYAHALVTVSLRMDCDYLKVIAGSGKEIRLNCLGMHDQAASPPSSLGSSPSGAGRGQWMTFCFLVENPSNTMTFQATDFGVDNAPGNNTSSLGTRVTSLMIGSCVMHGLASGGLTYPLLPAEKAESAFLLAFPEYPRVDCRGYTDSLPGSGDPTIAVTNPAKVIWHYLREVMDQDDATDTDLISFVTGIAQYQSYWKLEGLILEAEEDIKGPLVRMLRDAAAWLSFDPTLSRWKFRKRKSPAEIAGGSTDHVLTTGSWLGPNPILTRAGDAQLVDQVVLRYRRNWDMPRSPDAYAAKVTHGSGDRRRDENYLCDFVRDVRHAEELAEFRHAWDSVRTRRMSVNLLMKHLDVDKSDVVDVTYPIGGSSPAAYLLEARPFLVEHVGLVLGSIRSGSLSHIPADLVEVPDP